MDTKTVLIFAAVVVGGVVLYRQLKPGFSAPAAAAPYTVPSPNAPPKSDASTLDKVVAGVQSGLDIFKAGKSIWDTWSD